MRISVGASVMLLGIAVTSAVGDEESAEIRVVRDRRRMFHGLAMLLIGGMLGFGEGEGNGDWGMTILVGQCRVDISLGKSGVGPGDVILVVWVQVR